MQRSAAAGRRSVSIGIQQSRIMSQITSMKLKPGVPWTWDEKFPIQIFIRQADDSAIVSRQFPGSGYCEAGPGALQHLSLASPVTHCPLRATTGDRPSAATRAQSTCTIRLKLVLAKGQYNICTRDRNTSALRISANIVILFTQCGCES